MAEENDNLAEFENQTTAHTLPLGFLILYFGLIAWGVVYLYAYSPAMGGWSQAKAYEESVANPPARAP